jgi:hypothetical protein
LRSEDYQQEIYGDEPVQHANLSKRLPSPPRGEVEVNPYAAPSQQRPEYAPPVPRKELSNRPQNDRNAPTASTEKPSLEGIVDLTNTVDTTVYQTQRAGMLCKAVLLAVTD